MNDRVRPAKRFTRRTLPSTSAPREWRSTSTVTLRRNARENATRSPRPRGRTAVRRKPAVLAHAAPARVNVPAPENASLRPQPASTTRTGPSVSTVSAAPQVIRARSGCTVTVPTLRTFSDSASVRGFEGVAPHARLWEVNASVPRLPSPSEPPPRCVSPTGASPSGIPPETASSVPSGASPPPSRSAIADSQ